MKRLMILLTAVCALLSFSTELRADDKILLGFVTNNASDFWTIARAGVQKATTELGDVDVDFKIPADGTAATQKRIIEDLLARGVKGIAISPKDPANQTTVLNRAAERALVICHDSDAPNSRRAFYIGTDNTAAGRQAGQLIKEAVPQGGKIMVFVGTLSAQNAHDRLAGIKEALAGSNLQIIDVRTDETDRVRAKANVKDTIVKYPDIACLVGLWSYNGPAIINALRESGKAGQIKAVVFDEEGETLAGVRDGVAYATVVQQPFEFGYQSIVAMRKYIKGDHTFVPGDKRIIVPTRAIKKDNVDEFSSQLNKLLGK
jgi:ribose transport system substrate-binding protein